MLIKGSYVYKQALSLQKNLQIIRIIMKEKKILISPILSCFLNMNFSLFGVEHCKRRETVLKDRPKGSIRDVLIHGII